MWLQVRDFGLDLLLLFYFDLLVIVKTIYFCFFGLGFLHGLVLLRSAEQLCFDLLWLSRPGHSILKNTQNLILKINQNINSKSRIKTNNRFLQTNHFLVWSWPPVEAFWLFRLPDAFWVFVENAFRLVSVLVAGLLANFDILNLSSNSGPFRYYLIF